MIKETNKRYSIAFSKLLFSNLVHEGKIKAILKYFLRKKKKKKTVKNTYFYVTINCTQLSTEKSLPGQTKYISM